jgi:hypothetical protein
MSFVNIKDHIYIISLCCKVTFDAIGPKNPALCHEKISLPKSKK